MRPRSVRSGLICGTLLLSSLVFSLSSSAEVGVSEHEIVLGATNALTGPENRYGVEMDKGRAAFLKKLDAKGGINGRKIRLVRTDDKYEPSVALSNVQTLIEKDKVFALLGCNGSAGMAAIMPMITKDNLPLLFPYTGAEFLRVPIKKDVFNLRIGYPEEARALVKFAVKNLNVKEFGVFYQDDAFGTSGRNGVAKEVSEYGFKIKATASYKRNSTDIEEALTTLKTANPSIIYLSATTGPSADFIKKAAAKGFKPIYIASSPVGTLEILALLGNVDVDVYTSEVVPLPTENAIPIVKAYRDDMAAAGEKELSTVSLEGYLGAALFAEIAKKMGANITRDNMRTTIEGMKDFDLGGIKVAFGPDRHEGLSHNFIYKISKGKASLVE